MSIFLYILVMGLVTYLIRMLPFTLFRREIRSTFVKSLMYYIPYAVLAAMTVPAIFYSTGSFPAAIAGTVIALILAFVGMPLIVVALAAALAAFLFGFLPL